MEAADFVLLMEGTVSCSRFWGLTGSYPPTSLSPRTQFLSGWARAARACAGAAVALPSVQSFAFICHRNTPCSPFVQDNLTKEAILYRVTVNLIFKVTHSYSDDFSLQTREENTIDQIRSTQISSFLPVIHIFSKHGPKPWVFSHSWSSLTSPVWQWN